MNEDYKKVKGEREKYRIDQFLSLAKMNNGKIETELVAELWEISPSQVQKYVEYLVRKYGLPIERMVKTYPVYLLKDGHDVGSEKIESRSNLYTNETPSHNLSATETDQIKPKLIICPFCKLQIEYGKYCGECGSDLEASK